MTKYIPKEEAIRNSLKLHLENFMTEAGLRDGNVNENTIIEYFISFLKDAEVDSQIIVDVLEDERFGELGKEEARNIKIEEGW